MKLIAVFTVFAFIATAGQETLGAPVLFSEKPHEENKWIKGKEEGWFFYNEQDEEEKKPEEEEFASARPPEEARPLDIQQPPPALKQETKEKKDKEKPLTVEWFRKNYDQVLSRAIDNPTPENVKAYLFLQRVILDKSSNFAYAVRSAVYSEPLLDENIRIPLASAMRAALLKVRSDNVGEAFKYLSGKAGVWFFFRSDCQFCDWQYPVVKRFCNKHNLRLMPVSIDGGTIPALRNEKVWVDKGQSKRLGIVVVPSIALAVPERAEIIVVSQGTLSEEALEQRLLTAAIERELLPKEMIDNIDIFRRGILTPDQIANAPKEDDPVKLVNYIREQLQKSWGIDVKTSDEEVRQ